MGAAENRVGDRDNEQASMSSASCQIKSPASTKAVDPHEIGTTSITIDELRRLQEAGNPVIILDVRTDRSLDDLQAKGALRIPPDNAVTRVRELGLPKEGCLIAYCA
jgi:hypothetical protein